MYDSKLNQLIFKRSNLNNYIYTMTLLYIDPGSGSLLFQALLSGLLTIVVFFKRIVAYIKFRFGKVKETAEIEKKLEENN
jgi:hypothetical protein